LVGRLIFGGFFVMMGFMHGMKMSQMAQYAASKKVPLSSLAVLGTGILFVFGGLGVILGIFVSWAVAAIVLNLAGISVIMHPFWSVSDPQQKMMEQTQFLKNAALLGAALTLLAVAEPWAFSLF
ncbi:MAG: DoxX family protein, partial [bacterium]|nr:DoxX family protein [bacterium]